MLLSTGTSLCQCWVTRCMMKQQLLYKCNWFICVTYNYSLTCDIVERRFRIGSSWSSWRQKSRCWSWRSDRWSWMVSWQNSRPSECATVLQEIRVSVRQVGGGWFPATHCTQFTACLSVCPLAYLKNEIFVLVASGRGSVLLWWQCNTLRTSSFVSDVVFSYNRAYVAYNEDVSQREATQRGQKRSTESPPFCVASCWLTSLGRKPRHTKWSLTVEANNVLHTRGKVCYPQLLCMMIYVIFATFSFLINQYSFPESGLLQVGQVGLGPQKRIVGDN